MRKTRDTQLTAERPQLNPETKTETLKPNPKPETMVSMFFSIT